MDGVVIAMSSAADGSMSKAVDDDTRLHNREAFLSGYGISPAQTVLVHLEYKGNDYRRYSTVTALTAGSGIIRPSELIADALFTTDSNVALLLPIADCIAAVLYDSSKKVLGLAHLGRHNLLQEGGREIVEYMQIEFGSDPTTLQVWLSPAAGPKNYPLYDFDSRGLHEVALEQLLRAGVRTEHITMDHRDTTLDETLFSHSEFLKGKRSLDGRQAVVTIMSA